MMDQSIVNLIEEYKLTDKLDALGKNQDIKLVEEMSELTKEICKIANGGTDMVKVINEYADVIITMYTFAKRYNISVADIYDAVESKLKRFDRVTGGNK
ncbi:MAG: MazG-like family protein [Sarcina sp.]